MFKRLMASWNEWPRKKKIISITSLIAVIGISILGVLFIKNPTNIIKPVLTLEPPAPIEVSNREEFTVDVHLSNLPKGIYPAASVSIGFDKNKLEFTGVKMGTMETYGDTTLDGEDFIIPLWDCNVDVSNENGQINAMYLDMTAGRFAYSKDGFEDGTKDIVLRLGFKLRDSVQENEVYDLDIRDAVFATVDGDKDNSSLATSKNTLKVNNCKIVVQK